MSKFWSDSVKRLQPYVPGEQPKLSSLIKLNTNENPYPPSPKVDAALSSFASAQLSLYPDPNSLQLKQAIAAEFSVQQDQVFVGNGSDEVLAHAFAAFFKNKSAICFPDISYSFYPVYCQLFDIAFNTIALDNDFSIDINDYPDACGGIIFPNPNAPTGKFLALDQVVELARRHPDVVVIVDEAYVDFGGESAISLVQDYANILVVQTFSKSRALAGIRLGYAIGHADLIEALERVKNSFNSYPVNRLSEAAALASLSDSEYFQQACQRVIATRVATVAALQDLAFEVLDSKANFLLVKPPCDAAELFAALRQKNIIVRYFDKPRINAYLRISIGTDEEMQSLLDAIKQFLSS